MFTLRRVLLPCASCHAAEGVSCDPRCPTDRRAYREEVLDGHGALAGTLQPIESDARVGVFPSRP